MIKLQRDNHPPLAFIGKPIASASAERPGVDRWTEIHLYMVTQGANAGTYIVHTIGRTVLPGESNLYTAYICKTKEDLATELGHTWLARKLYEQAGISPEAEII